MKEEIPGEIRDEMTSREGGFHSSKAAYYLKSALQYYKDNAGMEQGKFLFLEEFLETAVNPYLYIYAQGLKRGMEVGQKNCVLTTDEYRDLMGFNEEENG